VAGVPITRSPLALGLSQLALFAPGIFFMLAAGHLADRCDRRWIILTCYSVQAVCTLALCKADALSAESLMQSNMQQSIAEPVA
jgi:MFS family permease